MRYRPVPWKPRNFRRVPRHLLAKAKNTLGPLVAGAVIKTTREIVESGKYAHLGILVEAGSLKFHETVIPPADMGRWSETNIYGYERVRKDLPMTQKHYSFEAPNFGDWGNGSHTVEWDRDVYERDYIPAKQLAIRVELLREDTDGNLTFSFRCEEVLERGKPGFDLDLLYNINLLQENLGHTNIFPVDATREDYLRTVTISWQILPPGTREPNIEQILGSRRSVSPEVQKQVEDRYDFLGTMRPKQIIAGTDGFRRYFGAQYADDLVVFENVDYGNAAYIMGHNWAELSRLSRLELLATAQREFVRVIHIGDWKKKVRKIVKKRLSTV